MRYTLQPAQVDKPGVSPCQLASKGWPLLPADGSVSTSNQQRDVPGPLFDGKWHMATLSSQPDGVKGYRCGVAW